MSDGVAKHDDADVVIVGGGPAGASTAYHLASAGIDALVLEKASFPRDKICGDGLTPAAVYELIVMGVDTSTWTRNRGLTVIGGGHRLQLEWPDQKSLPGYGMTRRRTELDQDLIQHACNRGARLVENCTVTGPLTDSTGRITGVRARIGQGKDAEDVEFHAKLVVDAGGVSARLATAMGREKNPRRPLGVAARTYFRSPRSNEEWMESHLELYAGQPGKSEPLPGYGWIFPMGDGTVNVGLGSVSSDAKATKLPYRTVLQQWVDSLPDEWGFTPDNQVGSLRSAALPMSFNRTPHYANSLVLVGDAGGMVSPFNGEGIAPALKAGRLAAMAMAQGLARTTLAGMDKAMEEYPHAMKQEYGGYYSMGRIFVRLIENPKVMHLCTHTGLGIPRLMTLVHKLLSDGFERSGGQWDDRLITTLTKVVPKV